MRLCKKPVEMKVTSVACINNELTIPICQFFTTRKEVKLDIWSLFECWIFLSKKNNEESWWTDRMVEEIFRRKAFVKKKKRRINDGCILDSVRRLRKRKNESLKMTPCVGKMDCWRSRFSASYCRRVMCQQRTECGSDGHMWRPCISGGRYHVSRRAVACSQRM